MNRLVNNDHSVSEIYLYRRKYTFIIIFLTLLPILRDLLFGFFFHSEFDFTNSHNLIHTGTEMALMLLFGVGFTFLDYRFNSEKQLREHLDILVDERTNEIKLNREISVEAFALLAEYREQDTGNHLKRVQFYVKIICEKLLSDSKYRSYLLRKNDYINDLMLASILHDIGKIAIPDQRQL